MRHSSILAGSFALFAAPISAAAHPDIETFAAVDFFNAPEVVECTLTDGSKAECYEFTVTYKPDDLEIGPFCPATLDDVGGIWDWTGEEAGVYRIDRAYLEFMEDLGYRFFQDDGTVNVITEGGAPNGVTHSCMALGEDVDVTMTMLLPVTPVMADSASDLGTVAKVGVAIDGIPIFADAPSIQERDNMPALDVCGGHVDPGGWYHWHATATDIETVYEGAGVDADCALEQDSTALFAYAFDGFAIYGSQDPDGSVPTDLDECNGHIGETISGETVYHYHAGETFPNLPTCLVGLQAEGNFSTTAKTGIGSSGGGQGGQGGIPPGFSEAAATLGIEASDLFAAIETAGGRDANMADVAAALGINEAALRAAMPARP